MIVEGVGAGDLLRISFEDGSLVYATSESYFDGDTFSGDRSVILHGYADIDEDFEIRVAAISDQGFPSAEVQAVVRNEPDPNAGCAVSNRSAADVSTSVLALLGLVAGSRRRRVSARSGCASENPTVTKFPVVGLQLALMRQ